MTIHVKHIIVHIKIILIMNCKDQLKIVEAILK